MRERRAMVVREFFCADMAAAASATSLFQSALIPCESASILVIEKMNKRVNPHDMFA